VSLLRERPRAIVILVGSTQLVRNDTSIARRVARTPVVLARWVARRPGVWVPLATLAAAGLLVLLLGPVAWWATPAKHLQGKDKADVRNATRQILLAAVGGMVLLIGAAFTARTFYLSRRGQFTDRYTKAIGQIASNSSPSALAASTLSST
jgi:hypothetical protein